MGSASNNLSADDLADDKVLTVIATEARELQLPEVARTLHKVKAGDSTQETLGKLGKSLQPELAKTYAFLLNKGEKDEEVTRLTVHGLKAMIIHRVKQLMPLGCPKCNRVYLNGRLDAPQVTCRMCGVGACQDCFTCDERMNKWTFLCGTCDQEIVGMKGEEALEDNCRRKGKKKKDKKNQKITQEKQDVIMEEENESDEEDQGDADEDREDDEVLEDPQAKSGGKDGKEQATKTPICHHFKRGRCRHGLSGKQRFNEVEKCPFQHPRICGRLLRNGDRGRGGCRGEIDGCKEFHQVRMCFSSMNTRKCTKKDCTRGYHVKGTVIQEMKESENAKLSTEQRAKEPEEQPKTGEKEPASDKNVPSFLEQMLLQQQEMMQQMQQRAEQQRNEQMQFQQQMLQMFARMGGAAESRPVSPMVTNQMMHQQPLSYRQMV